MFLIVFVQMEHLTKQVFVLHVPTNVRLAKLQIHVQLVVEIESTSLFVIAQQEHMIIMELLNVQNVKINVKLVQKNLKIVLSVLKAESIHQHVKFQNLLLNLLQLKM